MLQKIELRVACLEDLTWINLQYEKVNFKPSSFEHELIVIAEVKGVPVGVARLQHVDDISAELGGVFVVEHMRGLGVANSIIRYILDNSEPYKVIFCLPFLHLFDFYKRFGFDIVEDQCKVPMLVREKHKWCNKQYDKEVLLLNRELLLAPYEYKLGSDQAES